MIRPVVIRIRSSACPAAAASCPAVAWSTGGQLLQKPDITAADGVSVSGAGGFGLPAAACGASIGRCFFGTSAAAPHAAALAALIKSAKLSLTASQVKTALINSAIGIQA